MTPVSVAKLDMNALMMGCQTMWPAQMAIIRKTQVKRRVTSVHKVKLNFDVQSNLSEGDTHSKGKKWLLKTGDPLIQVYLFIQNFMKSIYTYTYKI